MRILVGLLAGLCVLVLVATSSLAQGMARIAGKMEATYTAQEPLAVGDMEEHTMTLARSDGTNASTGENVFMDGAQIVNISFADLVKGNGPHQGYITFTKDADAVYAKWEGTIKTTMSDEGTPMISFAGTFTYTGGMGQYEHIKGGGTYTGHFTSETEYLVEWEGDYGMGE